MKTFKLLAVALLVAAGTPALAGSQAMRESAQSVETDETQQQQSTTFTLHSIGFVNKAGGRTLIVMDKKYEPGLLGLDGFSHVYVLWWLHRNDTPQARAVLQLHPRYNWKNPMTGVFATRSPRRPNLIGLSLCKIVSVEENVVEIENIDAFADTPVLDVKPFIPGYDSAPDARLPDWLDGK